MNEWYEETLSDWIAWRIAFVLAVPIVLYEWIRNLPTERTKNND